MNYIGLISQFWRYNKIEPLGAVATSIYLFLLEIWKKNEESDFNLSDTEICERLKITRPTIIAIRQKLCKLGMIQYQSQNGLPGHYKINTDYLQGLAVVEKKESDTGGSRIKRSQKTIPKKNEIAEKSLSKKENTKNPNLTSNDSEKNIIPISISNSIPSLMEFTEYAKTLENYNSILDHLIKEKYESWLENGWRNAYDKPITNWKSSIKNTIPFLEKELDSPKNTSKKIALQSIKRPKSNFD
jgi:hypothetical protein